MQKLSASEAIGPAWEHTKTLLYVPRNWKLLLKLTAVALLAELGNSFSFNFSSPRNAHLPPAAHTALLGVALFFGFIFLIVGLVLFYVGSRLQFVLFDVVVRRYTTIGPIWRHYGSRTWRWIGLKLLVFITCLAALSPVLIPAIIKFIHAMPKPIPGQPAPLPSHFFPLFFSFLASIIVVVLLAAIVYFLFRDFALPSIAIEDVRIGTAIKRVWAFIRSEPGDIILYLIVRLLLGFVGAICLYIVDGIILAVSLLPIGIIGFLAWLTLHKAGIAGHVVLGLLAVIALVIAFAWAIIIVIVSFGTLFTFFQAYSAYFLAGRYPPLNDLLDPPHAPYWNPTIEAPPILP